MNLKSLKASPNVLNFLAIVLKLPVLAGMTSITLMRGGSFLVVIARKRSRNFFTTTARERFSMAMCFTFVTFVFGLSFSLRSKYKDQFLTRFLRNTLPALSPVSEKITWDTFGVIVNEGNNLLVKSPWRQGFDGHPIINSIDERPSRGLVSQNVSPNNETSSASTLHNPFLERLDLYNDAIVLRLKEPWDKVKNQSYIGLYPLDVEKLRNTNTVGRGLMATPSLINSIDDAGGGLSIASNARTPFIANNVKRQQSERGGVSLQNHISGASLANNGSGTLQLLQVPSRELFKQKGSGTSVTINTQRRVQTAKSVNSSQKNLSLIQKLLYKILLSLDEMPTKLGSTTSFSTIAPDNGVESYADGVMNPERGMALESQEGCRASHHPRSLQEFTNKAPTNWSVDAPLKDYTRVLPAASTIKDQRMAIGTFLEKSGNKIEVFLESGKPFQNKTTLEDGETAPLLIAVDSALQEVVPIPELTVSTQVFSDREERERESTFRQEVVELFHQPITTSDKGFDSFEDTFNNHIDESIQIELEDETGKDLFELVIDLLPFETNTYVVEPLLTTTLMEEVEGDMDRKAVPFMTSLKPSVAPTLETKDSLHSKDEMSNLESLDKTSKSFSSQPFTTSPSLINSIDDAEGGLSIASNASTPSSLQLFKKTRTRLMSGYLYPDLKRDEIEKRFMQLLVKNRFSWKQTVSTSLLGTKEVVLPPSLSSTRFLQPISSNAPNVLGSGSRWPLQGKEPTQTSPSPDRLTIQETLLPIAKIRYQDVFYSGLRELQKILSSFEIEIGDDELEEMDIWEIAYLGPAAFQDTATKDVIPRNTGEINNRIAELIRKLDERALFLDRKDNFLGKKEIFWGEGISREKLQLALQARPCNALLPEDDQDLVDGETSKDLYGRGEGVSMVTPSLINSIDDAGGVASNDGPSSHISSLCRQSEKSDEEPIKGGNLSFKDVFAGVEPAVTLLDSTAEDEAAPVELIITKSPSLCNQEEEIVSLGATEWSNVLKSIITHALSGKADLDKIELLLPSIMLTDQRSTSSPLPFHRHTVEKDGVLRSSRSLSNVIDEMAAKSVPSPRPHQSLQEVGIKDGSNRDHTVETLSSLHEPRVVLGMTGDEYETLYGLVPTTRSFVGEITYSPLTLDDDRLTKRREPLLVCHYLPPSQVALMEASTKQTLAPASYKKRVTSFSSHYPLTYNSTIDAKRGKTYSLVPTTQKRPLFYEIWEPIDTTSWMILYKLCFVMWVQEMGKDFYEKYGKEILLYALHLLVALGFNAQDIIEDLGLEDSSIRVIRKVDKRFADVAGITPLLPELGEIVWFLRSSGRGGQTPKGILLVGPPGTGKTFVVQAIAGEAKVPVVVQSASALTDPNQKKSGSQKLRDLFEKARQLSPCILFIDEIDTLGVSRPNVIANTMGKDELLESIERGADPSETSRQLAEIPPQLHFYKQFLASPTNSREDPSRSDENNDQDEYQSPFRAGEDTPALDPFVVEIIESHNQEHKSRLERLALLMQFLMEIDGLKSLHGVIVIGATNRPGVLDPAFTRPGRFEKTLCLQLPDKEKRIEILKLYAKKLHPVSADTASLNPALPSTRLVNQITDITPHTVTQCEDPSETSSRGLTLQAMQRNPVHINYIDEQVMPYDMGSDTPWDYIANRTAGLSAAHLAAVINQSSIKAIIDETGHTIETMEHGINRILKRSVRKSSVTSSLAIPKNTLPGANPKESGPESLKTQGDAFFAEQRDKTGKPFDEATEKMFNFEWNAESPLTGQGSCVAPSGIDMEVQYVTSFYTSSGTQSLPQITNGEEGVKFGGGPLYINDINDEGDVASFSNVIDVEEDATSNTSILAMEDKTLEQCTLHLLETLEDRGIWQILEGSLKGSLSSFGVQSIATASAKDSDSKRSDQLEAVKDVEAKSQGVVDWSSLQRFAFYQAGKAIVQTELPLHPSVSFLPLEPQVFHQSTSDLSRLLSPQGTLEPQRRVLLETRLIGIYAGKAGELLGLSSQELQETTQEDPTSSEEQQQPKIKESSLLLVKETQAINPLPDLSPSGQAPIQGDITDFISSQSEKGNIKELFSRRVKKLMTSALCWQSEKSNMKVLMKEGILEKGLTLQSDLGVEELSFAGLIANHMINTWYLYSKRIASQKFNLAHVSQEENEIKIDDPVLLDLFRHLEKTIEDETRLARRTSFVYQHRFAPAWWETQTMTEESLVEPSDSDWYRLYIPDPEETERNIDWVAPDDCYHATSANLLRNTSRMGIPSHLVKKIPYLRIRELFATKANSTGSAITWNDFYLINRDYIYQALVSSCLHKAINLLDTKRELLDLFADQLVRYNLLRQHEIGTIWRNFTTAASPPYLSSSVAKNSQEELVPSDATLRPSSIGEAIETPTIQLENISTQEGPQTQDSSPKPLVDKLPNKFSSRGEVRGEVSRSGKGSQQTTTARKTKRVKWGSYSRRETANFVDFDFVKPCFFKKQSKEGTSHEE
jgi:SpoVK/Ycf46/Vps4 family AAA+-type ATPase